MSNQQLYLLIACAFFIYIGFALGILYLKRRLRKQKVGLTIVIPIFVSFAMGISLLMFAFSQI